MVYNRKASTFLNAPATPTVTAMKLGTPSLGPQSFDMSQITPKMVGN